MEALNNTTGWFPDSNETVAPKQLRLDYVGFFSVPFFLVIGVTGNVLTIIVMRSKPFNKFSSSYVLICLAVSDTVLNVLLPFNKTWVNNLLGVDIRSVSDTNCQAFYWAFRTAKMTSSWLVVLICMERFVAVCLPLKAPVICRKRYALLGICLIYLIIGTYNAIWVPFADRLVNGVCRPNTQPPGYVTINRTFLIVGLSIYALVPSVIMIVMTTLIVLELYKAKRTRKSMTMMLPQTYKDPTSKTTRMLVCIIVAFVILVLPIAFGHLFFFIKRKPIFASQDKTVVIYREISTFLEHMNYSINFFLYVVACPSFRNHLPYIFKCKCRGADIFSRTRSKENLALHDSSGSDKSKSTSSGSAAQRQSAVDQQAHNSRSNTSR